MKVKVLLQPGQSQEDAQDLLYKALAHQRSPDVHTEQFSDPEVHRAFIKLQDKHEELLAKMLDEILAVVDAK